MGSHPFKLFIKLLIIHGSAFFRMELGDEGQRVELFQHRACIDKAQASTFASISRLDVIVRSASSSQTRSSAAVGVVVVIGNPPFCLLGRWGVEVGGRREPLSRASLLRSLAGRRC